VVGFSRFPLPSTAVARRMTNRVSLLELSVQLKVIRARLALVAAAAAGAPAPVPAAPRPPAIPPAPAGA